MKTDFIATVYFFLLLIISSLTLLINSQTFVNSENQQQVILIEQEQEQEESQEIKEEEEVSYHHCIIDHEEHCDPQDGTCCSMDYNCHPHTGINPLDGYVLAISKEVFLNTSSKFLFMNNYFQDLDYGYCEHLKGSEMERELWNYVRDFTEFDQMIQAHICDNKFDTMSCYPNPMAATKSPLSENENHPGDVLCPQTEEVRKHVKDSKARKEGLGFTEDEYNNVLSFTLFGIGLFFLMLEIKDRLKHH